MIRKSPATLRAEVTRYAETFSVAFITAAAELAEDAIYAAGQTDLAARGTRSQYRLIARTLVRSAHAAGVPLHGPDAVEPI